MGQFKEMKIIKVGQRVGSKGIHAFVEYNGKYKLVALVNGRWQVLIENRIHPLVRSNYLSELF